MTPVDRGRRGAPGGERGGRAGAVYRGKPRRPRAAGDAEETPKQAAPRPRNDRKRPRKSDTSLPRRDRPEPGRRAGAEDPGVGGPGLAPRLRRPHPRRPGHHQRTGRDPGRQGRPGARLDQGRRQAGMGIVAAPLPAAQQAARVRHHGEGSGRASHRHRPGAGAVAPRSAPGRAPRLRHRRASSSSPTTATSRCTCRTRDSAARRPTR